MTLLCSVPYLQRSLTTSLHHCSGPVHVSSPRIATWWPLNWHSRIMGNCRKLSVHWECTYLYTWTTNSCWYDQQQCSTIHISTVVWWWSWGICGRGPEQREIILEYDCGNCTSSFVVDAKTDELVRYIIIAITAIKWILIFHLVALLPTLRTYLWITSQG